MPAMMTRAFKAVTLDVGNTLLYCDPSPPEIYAAALSRLGRRVEAVEVAPVFRDAWAERQRQTPLGVDRYGAAPGGERAWWGTLLQEILVRLDHDAPWQHLLDELYAAFTAADVWRLYDDALSTVTGLRERGLKVAVISNWDSRLPGILAGLGVDSLFETITVSALEGVEKPAPAIFARTVERLGLSAAEVLHVGDSPLEDYAGAEAAGLAAVLVDRSRLFTTSDLRRVDRLAEVLDLVGPPSPSYPI